MTISSRTPEGTPNRCPLCGHSFRIEPSRPFGDAPCPACGSLLWFIDAGEGTRFYPETDESLAFVADRLGINPDAVRAGGLDWPGVDSLDVAELLMDWEERFGDPSQSGT